MWIGVALLGCRNVVLETCDCPSGVVGHAFVLEGACQCLESLPMTPLPASPVIFELADGEEVDWDAVDAALVDDDVVVRFDRTGSYERLAVLRTDSGPNRLVLDGGGGNERAVVAGVYTPFYEGPRHRVTVRGFEVTGSRDKGIFWDSGDDVLIEDVVIHENRGSPALNLQYSNRTGTPSRGFTVRNSHLYDQRGECLYIGGSEGEDLDSHTDVVIENNVIHDCYADLDSKHDAINVKDRLSNVRVERNVVGRADWGIEVASPGVYRNNLVFDTRREGFQVSDAFAPIGAMSFVDNVVLRPGHDGFHFAQERELAPAMRLERNTVIGAGQAGLLIAGEAGIELDVDGFVVLDSAVGFDGWGVGEVTVDGCAVGGNGIDAQRLLEGVSGCTELGVPEVSAPAGPDGLFFTEDDPWLMAGGAGL